MTTRRTILNLMGAGAASTLAFALIASPAAAQTATQTATSQGVIAGSTPGTKKPTTSTPRMIDEAIQRSQARAAKARATGTTETFGSEEPFTYVPGKVYN